MIEFCGTRFPTTFAVSKNNFPRTSSTFESSLLFQWFARLIWCKTPWMLSYQWRHTRVPILISVPEVWFLGQRAGEQVGPCDDFHEHVCNFAENANDTLVYELRRKFADDVARLLGGYDDPIVDFARRALTLDDDDKYAEETGRRMGAESAFFRSPMRVRPNASMYRVDMEYKARGRLHTTTECYYSQCPPFLRAVLDAFVQHSYVGRTNHKLWKISAVFPKDLDRRPFTATEKSRWWIPKEQKASIAAMIRRVKPLLYLPSEARDPRSMAQALTVYQAEFARNSDYLESLYARRLCDTRCLMAHLGTVVRQGMGLYHGSFHGTSRYIEFWIVKDNQAAMGIDVAWGGRGKISIFPSILQYLHRDLPVGLLYSTAATVISHELLHNLDSVDADKEATVLWKNPIYKEGFECYSRHYSSFVAHSPSGEALHPRGDLQKNEGFADVEGLRIALKIFRQMEPAASEEDLRWFFYGVELFRCVFVRSDHQLLLKTLDVPHPRYTVRGKAQMTQVSQFSEVFRCQRGDPMFLVDKPCEVFVPN
uniref:Peptidase_M13 domain-containing protein n=1 Tax=Steinernema glaseri TaxID=37863 RepID=A0A1I8ATQ7_9BILA